MNNLLFPLMLFSFCVLSLNAQNVDQESTLRIKKLVPAKEISAEIDLVPNRTDLFKKSDSNFFRASEFETPDSTKVIEINSHYILNNNELSLAELRKLIINSKKQLAIEEMEHGMVIKNVGLPFSVIGSAFTFFGGAGIIAGLIMTSGSESLLSDMGIVMATSGISHLFVGEIFHGIRKKHIRKSVELYNSAP